MSYYLLNRDRSPFVEQQIELDRVEIKLDQRQNKQLIRSKDQDSLWTTWRDLCPAPSWAGSRIDMHYSTLNTISRHKQATVIICHQYFILRAVGRQQREDRAGKQRPVDDQRFHGDKRRVANYRMLMK